LEHGNEEENGYFIEYRLHTCREVRFHEISYYVTKKIQDVQTGTSE